MVVEKTKQVDPWDITTWRSQKALTASGYIIFVPSEINIYNGCNERCDIIGFHCVCGSQHTVDDFKGWLQKLKLVEDEKLALIGRELADLPDMRFANASRAWTHERSP